MKCHKIHIVSYIFSIILATHIQAQQQQVEVNVGNTPILLEAPMGFFEVSEGVK